MKAKTWLVGFSALCVVGCSQNYSNEEGDVAMAEKGFTPVPKGTIDENSESRQAQAEGLESAIKNGQRQDLGGISVVMPSGWEQMSPANQMRLAEYRLPGGLVKAADAVLTVFHFGRGQGGAVDANIERWYGQFTQVDGTDTRSKARRWQKVIQGIEVHWVDISGEFSGGMGSEPIANARMLGVIAEASAGAFFFKVVGPIQTINHWEASFEQYVASFRDPETL